MALMLIPQSQGVMESAPSGPMGVQEGELERTPTTLDPHGGMEGQASPLHLPQPNPFSMVVTLGRVVDLEVVGRLGSMVGAEVEDTRVVEVAEEEVEAVASSKRKDLIQ